MTTSRFFLRSPSSLARFLPWLIAVALAGACAPGAETETYPETGEKYGRTVPAPDSDTERESLFGEGKITLFGTDLLGGEDEPDSGAIPVNIFLWRATLDTLSFMPLASADPFSGVVITDWYAPARDTNERFKVTAYILSRQLRADGLRLSVFRQIRTSESDWMDTPVAAKTTTGLEDAILTRARQLRIDAQASEDN